VSIAASSGHSPRLQTATARRIREVSQCGSETARRTVFLIASLFHCRFSGSQ
jgi:hypothetical protein